MTDSPPTLQWMDDVDGRLVLIDQTRLPVELIEFVCADVETVIEAICSLRVRGAPAIGIAAAYGVCLGMQGTNSLDVDAFFGQLDDVIEQLASSRPTAVNLTWALERMRHQAGEMRSDGQSADIRRALLAEARAIEQEDRDVCRAIGRHASALLGAGEGVMTHCNAGGLATADYGTALAAIFTAEDEGKQPHVYVCETRPLLQGSRLTAWELVEREIDATLICDSMAAQVMREGRVQAVITGADRIAANGDVANKIGTYSLALVAAAHEIPFYVAAPISTFDLSLASGESIPIEQRAGSEVTHSFGQPTAPEGIAVYNPAFDVTPARLVTAIICERGVIRPVSGETIAAVVT
jgi:methylthioribose-1-phosphate isomerase